jgi:hypothetical protein
MSDGLTALVIMGIGIGGYAAYRHFTHPAHTVHVVGGRSAARTGSSGYYTGACGVGFEAADPRTGCEIYAGYYAGSRSGRHHFKHRVRSDDQDDS